MKIEAYFSSSSKVWEDISWVYGIEEAGYDGWEVSADGNYRLEVPKNLAAVKEVLETTNLGATVHAPYSDLNTAAINDPICQESVDQICACIKYASEFTDRVTVHPGYLSPVGKLVPEQVWELQKQSLIQIGKFAEEYGVLACLENMPDIPDFLCKYLEEMFGLAEEIEGIGFTLDIGHANTVGNPDQFIKHLKNIDHIHVHDNNGKYDEHLALGMGNIDWEKIGKSVISEYSGVVVVEGRSIPEASESIEVMRRCFV